MIYIKFNGEAVKFFDSFCTCNDKKNEKDNKSETVTCKCGEEYEEYEWTWDDCNLVKSASLSENKRDVLFHQTFSSGTGAVRGNVPFQQNCHYYWEIKMLTALYGTDVMVGVGTDNVDMNLWPYRFCSLLGLDKDSWGYSYRGQVQHDGRKQEYGPRFGVGSIIGVHLDMCKGTLEYYLNRQPLGIAFTGLKSYRLYPMVCSTAAQSAMRVTCSISLQPTLQMLALKRLTSIDDVLDIANVLDSVPGLRKLLVKKFWWLLASYEKHVPQRTENKHGFRLVQSDEDDDDCPNLHEVKRRPVQQQRKRKRDRSCSSGGLNESQEILSSNSRLTDGPTSSDVLLHHSVVKSSDMIFAPCDTCGIVRAIGSKKTSHANRNRVCLYCDAIFDLWTLIMLSPSIITKLKPKAVLFYFIIIFE